MTEDRTESGATSIVWLRRDLRLADNPALLAAARIGPVLPVFILEEHDILPLGGASRWWLHHSLRELGRALESLGSPLILRRGNPVEIMRDIVEKTGANELHFNRRYDPHGRRADGEVTSCLRAQGIAVQGYAANLLFEPGEILNGSGRFYRVFTAFWRAVSALPSPRAPLPAPGRLEAPLMRPETEPLDDWRLAPTRPNWAEGFESVWRPGEASARERLSAFIEGGLRHYAEERDRPDRDSTSMLSPHLSFGEISPFTIWHALKQFQEKWEPVFRPELRENNKIERFRNSEKGGNALRQSDADERGAAKFRQELVWREFSHHLLFHFPDLAKANFNPSFDAFPWRRDAGALEAWQRGQTGYPIVDAGMRQLWQTGWMHNRVRMIAASFLIKHLLIDWRVGEDWFRDTLVDADPANNPASWQWVAGSGADAAPYFRIFNPVLQGEKFDPAGAYVRHWVPEIAALPDRFIHQPWRATGLELAAAGIRLGETYPEPIVDHARARDRALRAFKTLSG